MSATIQEKQKELVEKQLEVKEKQQEIRKENRKEWEEESKKHNETMQQVSRASKIMDTAVKNSSGDNLGTVKELVLDPMSGHMVYAVVSFGGVFGLGDKLFAIPWKALHWSSDNEHYTLNLNKSALEKAPGFDKNHWPDSSNKWDQLREELEQFYCSNG